MRPAGRAAEAMREVTLEPGVAKYAEGSCLARFGDTHVLCAATIEDRVPPFLRNTGRGCGSPPIRHAAALDPHPHDREAARGRQSGEKSSADRAQPARRTDLAGARRAPDQIDCDVLQADGGRAPRRSPAAMSRSTRRWQMVRRALAGVPLNDSVAAISCGVFEGAAVLDLDYAEDSQAMTDANFVMTGGGGIVEIQATAEGAPFDDTSFARMLALARAGIAELTHRQRAALGLS